MSRLTERARSRSGIGADYARAWARQICLRNPHAKAVLMALANYMNEDGSAYPGIATIARDTDLSEDTVVGRLKWMSELGLIALFKCWIDENGRRNHDGRGRVTSSEIRFLFDVDVDEIEEKIEANAKPQALRGAALESAKSIRDQDVTSPRHGREQTPVDESVLSQGLAPGQPPPPAARTEELEQDSPQKPPLPDEPAPPIEQNEVTPYERFSEVYGEGSVRPERARSLWRALSEAERDLAIRAARGYRAQRAAAKKSLMDPERFLRDPNLWREFASKPAASAADMRTVPSASPEGRAIRCLGRLSGKTPFVSQSNGQDVIFAKAAPATPQILALSRCVDDSGREVVRWVKVGIDSNAFGAWRDLIGKTTGLRPFVRYAETTIAVPAEWPPRADGSWPEFELSLQRAG